MTEAPPVQVGDVIAGKYRIDELIEEGGMAFIARATHLGLRKRVAIKLLHPKVLETPAVLARFRREARALAMLRSEHVVRVLDVDELPNHIPYMVLEFLEGEDLGRLLESRGTLPVAEAVSYMLQACDAIIEAHTQGIVHRDIKPANLFLARTQQGGQRIKVIDFGAARTKFAITSDPEPSLTRTGLSLGTPGYMAPEQLRGEKVDKRVDVWALGVSLYELLAGFPPFMGMDQASMVTQVLRTAPAPLSSLRDDIPVELDAVIRRCLAKVREQRMASVEALAEAIEPFAHG